MRAAILVPTLSGGGLERALISVARHWPYQQDLVMMTCDDSGPYRDEIPPNMDLIVLRESPSVSVIRFGLRLRTILRLHSVDVLITSGFGFAHYVLLLKVLGFLGKTHLIIREPSVLSVKLREKTSNPLVHFLLLVSSRCLYRFASAVVGISRGVAKDLETTLRLPHESVVLIHNAIDEERIREEVVREAKSPEEFIFERLRHPIVITVGRLVPEKAHADLVVAFSRLPQSHQGTLVILGEGILRTEIEEAARRLGISHRVWLPGFRKNPWWFVARSDVFVLPSHWEGFANVVTEAAACGVPIVSTDCPHGPREILSGMDGATLVPVGDTQAITTAISAALSRGSVNYQRDLSRYSTKQMSCRYANLASTILAGDELS